jgi:hypothetical protein
MKAFNFSKLSPVARGKSATEKRIAIAENGQVRFNSLASNVFKQSVTDPKNVIVYFLLDDNNNLLIDTKPFKKREFPDLEKDYSAEYGKALSFNKEAAEKDGNYLYYISIAGLLGDAGYDYRTSGTQTFNMVSDPSKPTRLAFKLPQGALPKREITPRKRREKVPQIEQQKEPELVEA